LSSTALPLALKSQALAPTQKFSMISPWPAPFGVELTALNVMLVIRLWLTPLG
jgi:hypothetical protein